MLRTIRRALPVCLPLVAACCFVTSVSCALPRQDPHATAALGLDYRTAFSDQDDERLVLDSRNTRLEIDVPAATGFTEVAYTITSERTQLLGTEPVRQGKAVIDLRGALEEPLYRTQPLTVQLLLSGNGRKKTVEHDATYVFVAESPIPFVSITAASVPDDRTKLAAEYAFFETPDERGWYSLFGPATEGAGTIHARGQSSLGPDFLKKSFAVNLGNENPVKLMGMSESHKWVMIGNWVDATHLANKVSYDLYAEMGHFGPQSRHVQVYINGDYWGLYTFGERVERGKHHVDTRKKSKGGFIVKLVDSEPDFQTITGRTFAYEYPDPEDATPAIAETLDRYEAKVVQGGDWRADLNEDAELDYFILADVFANPDSYYNDKNLFYFLNRDDRLEPVIWDFIWAFGPPYFTNRGNDPWGPIYFGDELMYGNPNNGPALGQNKFCLMQFYVRDEQNVRGFKSRYAKWRAGPLADARLDARVTGLIETLRSGAVYELDRQRWPELATDRYTPEQFREKLLERLDVMDRKVPRLAVQEGAASCAAGR